MMDRSDDDSELTEDLRLTPGAQYIQDAADHQLELQHLLNSAELSLAHAEEEISQLRENLNKANDEKEALKLQRDKFSNTPISVKGNIYPTLPELRQSISDLHVKVEVLEEQLRLADAQRIELRQQITHERSVTAMKDLELKRALADSARLTEDSRMLLTHQARQKDSLTHQLGLSVSDIEKLQDELKGTETERNEATRLVALLQDKISQQKHTIRQLEVEISDSHCELLAIQQEQLTRNSSSPDLYDHKFESLAIELNQELDLTKREAVNYKLDAEAESLRAKKLEERCNELQATIDELATRLHYTLSVQTNFISDRAKLH
eukprot:m.67255 g.67255  ORF g.67255 m.67255 type:complete len:322 (+) comp11873_c0_seq2:176-1141(+)